MLGVETFTRVTESLVVLAQVLASIRSLREERSIEALLKWTIAQDARIDKLEAAVSKLQKQ